MATRFLSSSSKASWDHDVFLSFRGEDTRKNFTDHLYKALVQAGIHTFRDKEDLRRGRTISTELRKAICGSRIFIVVFSKNYASSTWCLDELTEIMDCCRKNTSHTLLPIFYHVDPSDVRKQTGTFAEAFAKHKNRFHANMVKVEKWKEALTEAGSSSGWDVSSVANGYEGKFIEEIVDQVLSEASPIHFHVAEYPVGIDSRVEEVKDLLNIETSDIRIVGIYGMGGIGKTTIAKALYNKIYFKFEGFSFLSDIKETSTKVGGLVQFQKQLLYDILEKDLRIDNNNKGIVLIKKLLKGKRVFVVLDDVDDLDQICKLFGDLKGFGLGSRFIITTRDEHLLTQLEVHGRYMVSQLNELNSLALFSWHAFGLAYPRLDFQELAISALNYAEGLPLALKVLGSFLKGRSFVEWKNELEKLQNKPNDKIQGILRISFDSLDMDTKEIFLDIACFFLGMEKYHITKILEGSGFFPNIGMKILEQRSLLIIQKDKLQMHSLVQYMGREIVRENANYIPENYSRLWSHEDVLDVLNKQKGSHHVKGLSLNSLELEDQKLKTEAFTSMKNLRLLQINAIHLTGNFKHLSNELRWLSWHKYPLQFLSQDFYLENLVVLDLLDSKIVQIWNSDKILNKLKVLNLQNCEDLIVSPNFSQVPHLEILILAGCTSLLEVHESIGYLTGLVELNLKGCLSLVNLPSSIFNLESLKTLDMSECSKLFWLSKQVGSSMGLTKEHGSENIPEQKSFFFGHLKNFKIELFGCERRSSDSWLSYLSRCMSPKSSTHISLPINSISRFRSLEKLNLRDCGLSEDNFVSGLENLSSLISLDLSGNNFHHTPHDISRLPKLLLLQLRHCKALQSISGVPPSLKCLCALDSYSLRSLQTNLPLLDIECSPIFSISESDDQVTLQRLTSFPYLLIEIYRNTLQMSGESAQFCIVFLQTTEVPHWFSYQAIGCSISFRIPPVSEGLIYYFLVCASYGEMPYASNWTSTDGPIVAISFYNKTTGSNLYFHTKVPLRFAASRCHIYRMPLVFRSTCTLGIYYLERRRFFTSNPHGFCLLRDEWNQNEMEFRGGDEMEVSIEFRGGSEVRKCGIHLRLGPVPVHDDISENDINPDDFAQYKIRRQMMRACLE